MEHICILSIYPETVTEKADETTLGEGRFASKSFWNVILGDLDKLSGRNREPHLPFYRKDFWDK